MISFQDFNLLLESMTSPFVKNKFEQQYHRAKALAEKDVDVDVMMALKQVGKLKVYIDLNLPVDVIKQQCEVFHAVGTGQTDTVVQMVKKGTVDVNVQSENGVSLVYVSSRFGHTKI